MCKSNWNTELVQQYLSEGLNTEQIAKCLHISASCLRKHCAKENIILSTKNNPNRGKTLPKIHPEIDRQWLIDHWVNTDKSMHQLALEFNVSEALIETRRSKYNLYKTFKYKVNLDKLFNLQDPNVWYIAGLLATDGYFPKKSDSIEFTLVGSSEQRLLNKIKDYFECTAPVMQIKNNYYRLRICGPGIQKFFSENFNIPLQNKTFTLQIPNKCVPEEFIIAYLRGCIDGDGHINKKCNRLCLVTASESFIQGFKKLLEDITQEEVMYVVRKNKSDTEYPGIILKEAGLHKLCLKMYSEDAIYLDRKFQQCSNKYGIL